MKFWKKSQVYLVSFGLEIRSPNGKLLWRSSVIHKNESSSSDDSDWYWGGCAEVVERVLMVVDFRWILPIFYAFDLAEGAVGREIAGDWRWLIVVFVLGLWLVLNV